MNIPQNSNRILELKLSGKFAHFRKFYTNASSLTYLIPPRTAICGLLASILQIERDCYYNLMSSDKLGIAISLVPNIYYHKVFQTLNYAQDKSKNIPINDLSAHKQCRLELLKAQGTKNLEWILYLCFNSAEENNFAELENKIKEKNFGYGLYLGQRQFIAHLELIRTYSQGEFKPISESDYLDSAIERELIEGITSQDCDLIMERMPLEQELIEGKRKSYRQTKRFGNIVIETNGKRIPGKFKDLIELQNIQRTRISFL
jgi:CRISPR-associated protein Cas5h